jgi:tetratricopeptide (TPR) repeat protein
LEGDQRPVLFTRLEAACHEVLRADAQSESLEASGDQDAVARVRRKIEDEVLPSVAKIAEGAGNQMAFSHFALGLTLRVLERREEALRAFLKANELQEGAPNTLLEIVRCLGELGRVVEALPFARTATAADPTSAAAWGNLAACLHELGQFGEACVAIDRAVALDPLDAINLRMRDRIHRRT